MVADAPGAPPATVLIAEDEPLVALFLIDVVEEQGLTAIGPAASTTAGVLACAWAFHVGVDRALGYGLKMPDAFTHTHLGWIGKDRSHLGATKRLEDGAPTTTGIEI